MSAPSGTIASKSHPAGATYVGRSCRERLHAKTNLARTPLRQKKERGSTGYSKKGFSTATLGKASHPRTKGMLLPTVDRITESFIEIRDTEYRELITVIELLSPTNKRQGPDRDQYLSKRSILISNNVNYVEIDLLRGDARMPFAGLSECDYCVMVCRSYRRPEVELWPMDLCEPLPTIPIPLKQEHADAVVDLQSLLHELYDAAGYADYIYAGQPRPALSAANREWAKSIIEQPNN